MSQILGTDGNRDAWGKPTIIRDPIENDEQEHRFYVALLSALLFSNGFYLDVAWLTESPLCRPLENSDSSLRRMLAKGYIQLVSRIPQEDIPPTLPVHLKESVKQLDIWSWPTQPMKTQRIQNGEWVQFHLPAGDNSLIKTNDNLESKSENGFIVHSHDESEFEAPIEFWNIASQLEGTLGEFKTTVISQPTNSINVVTTAKASVIKALEDSKLNEILGVANQNGHARNEYCRSMLNSILRMESGVNEGSLTEITEQGKSTAMLLGLSLCKPGIYSVSVSLADVIGFILCWDQR